MAKLSSTLTLLVLLLPFTYAVPVVLVNDVPEVVRTVVNSASRRAPLLKRALSIGEVSNAVESFLDTDERRSIDLARNYPRYTSRIMNKRATLVDSISNAVDSLGVLEPRNFHLPGRRTPFLGDIESALSRLMQNDKDIAAQDNGRVAPSKAKPKSHDDDGEDAEDEPEEGQHGLLRGVAGTDGGGDDEAGDDDSDSDNDRRDLPAPDDDDEAGDDDDDSDSDKDRRALPAPDDDLSDDVPSDIDGDISDTDGFDSIVKRSNGDQAVNFKPLPVLGRVSEAAHRPPQGPGNPTPIPSGNINTKPNLDTSAITSTESSDAISNSNLITDSETVDSPEPAANAASDPTPKPDTDNDVDADDSSSNSDNEDSDADTDATSKHTSLPVPVPANMHVGVDGSKSSDATNAATPHRRAPAIQVVPGPGASIDVLSQSQPAASTTGQAMTNDPVSQLANMLSLGGLDITNALGNGMLGSDGNTSDTGSVGNTEQPAAAAAPEVGSDSYDSVVADTDSESPRIQTEDSELEDA